MHRFFNKFWGSMPQTPLPALATYKTRVHAFCESKTLTLTLKLVATALSVDWNYFRCVKVCQVHNDPSSMASRLLCSHENTLCFKYWPPNTKSWMRPCGSIVTVSNIWDPDQARRFVWSDLAKIIILRASPLVSYRILGRGYCSTSLLTENK